MSKNKVRKKNGKKVKYNPPKKKGMNQNEIKKFIDLIKNIQNMPKASQDEITEESIGLVQEVENEYNGNESQEK